MNQHGEDLLGEIGIRADGLGLSANSLDDDALTSGVTHHRSHGCLCSTDLARLGQASADCDDDL